MPVFEWSEDYETGIPDIDSDHMEIFSLINNLHSRYENDNTQNEIEAAISSLLSYVDRHFEREETLLSTVKYGGLAAHATAHKLLGEEMHAYAELYNSNPEGFDMANFVSFLLNWLKGHILTDDMAYLPTVKLFVNRL